MTFETYSDYQNRICLRAEEKPFPKGVVFCSTADGTWVSDKNGTKVMFYDGIQVMTVSWIVADPKWQKKRKAIGNAVDKMRDTDMYLADVEAIDIRYTGDLHTHKAIDKAVRLRRVADDGSVIDTYVDKTLLREIPKNALYYTTGWCDPVLVCLPEDKYYRGRILPIAIILPFNPRDYEISDAD